MVKEPSFQGNRLSLPRRRIATGFRLHPRHPRGRGRHAHDRFDDGDALFKELEIFRLPCVARRGILKSVEYAFSVLMR